MYDVTTAKLFLLDMDGTFYLDDTLLPGALEFLALCRATGRQFAFLTNNCEAHAPGRGRYRT